MASAHLFDSSVWFAEASVALVQPVRVSRSTQCSPARASSQESIGSRSRSLNPSGEMASGFPPLRRLGSSFRYALVLLSPSPPCRSLPMYSFGLFWSSPCHGSVSGGRGSARAPKTYLSFKTATMLFCFGIALAAGQ